MTVQADEAELLQRHGRVQDAVHAAAPVLRLAREVHQSRRDAPMLFHDKPSLPALYEALPKLERADIQKSGQCGGTELLILLGIYEAGWRSRIFAYVLPTDVKIRKFVADRIDRMFQEVPAYRKLLPYGTSEKRKPDAGNLSRKSVGRGTMLFLGSETRNNWTEWSADTLVIDEYDDCEENNVALGPDRIEASTERRLIHVSNPTRGPNTGINALWNAGSRGAWYQRCTRCKHRQRIDWFGHVVERADDGRWIPRDTERAGDDGPLLGDIRPVCAKCRRPFDRSGEGGLWVHEQDPKRVKPSFAMSRLDALPRADKPQPYRELYARWVAAQGDDAAITAFFVMALGQPRRPEGGAMSVEVLQAAAKGAPMDMTGATTPGRAVLMSSDVGTTFHVNVSELVQDLSLPDGGRRRKLWAGTARSWADLESIRKRYHPGIIVVDNGPETTAGRDWCTAAEEASQGEAKRGEGPICYAFRCAFHQGSRAAGSDLAVKLDAGDRLVTVDRTQLLDRAWYDLRDGLCVLPSDIMAVPGFSQQMCTPVRVVNEQTGQASWTKGNDHYRLADGYERVALALAGIVGCEKVPVKKG